MSARFGVDIGGTFTDLVVVDEESGAIRVGKVLTTAKDPAHGVDAVKTSRRAWFAEAAGWIDTLVYDRYALGPGATFAGPAIVEERESTAVIGPGASCGVDDGLTLVVHLP